MNQDNHATVFGLISAGLLGNVPVEWLSYGEKLVTGAVLAFITGFAYKASGFLWDKYIVKGKKQ